MDLRWPNVDMLDEYVAALRSGWSPNTMRPEAAAEELDEIAVDPVAFVASLVDREAAGPPFRQPDGSLVQRIPGYHKWMWDGEFAGAVNFRWMPGTAELPAQVPGHIGYTVVPWKRGRGYATHALGLMLGDARREGLTRVEITTDRDNIASQTVIERCGGVLVGRFTKPGSDGPVDSLRFRIDLGVTG